jgi:hypothetical protein
MENTEVKIGGSCGEIIGDYPGKAIRKVAV